MELLPECGVDKSVNTRAAHVCTLCETKSLCKNAKCEANTLFVTQTVTISVATAGYFSLVLGFTCFIWGSRVFIENFQVWYISSLILTFLKTFCMSDVFYCFLFFFKVYSGVFFITEWQPWSSIGEQKISPESDFFKTIFTDSD